MASRKLRKDEAQEGIDASAILSVEAIEASASKAGFLLKRSDQGLIKNWKRRWVVLNDKLLYYFENAQAKK